MEKEKLIAGISNFGEENYIRLKIRKKDTKKLEVLCSFMGELGLKLLFDYKYKDRRLMIHQFLKNKDYSVHIIFEEKYTHLIIRTKKREDMIKKLTKYFGWIKSRK